MVTYQGGDLHTKKYVIIGYILVHSPLGSYLFQELTTMAFARLSVLDSTNGKDVVFNGNDRGLKTSFPSPVAGRRTGMVFNGNDYGWLRLSSPCPTEGALGRCRRRSLV